MTDKKKVFKTAYEILDKVSEYEYVNTDRLHGSIAYYDAMRDVIWLFGGKNDSDFIGTVMTFDYKTDTFNISKPKLGFPAYDQNNNGIVIDDILYFIDQKTYFLMSYDLETGISKFVG